jgi:hypothetical protein
MSDMSFIAVKSKIFTSSQNRSDNENVIDLRSDDVDSRSIGTGPGCTTPHRPRPDSDDDGL